MGVGVDKTPTMCYNKDTKEREVNAMKTYYRLPTHIIVRRESCVHICGKWWWDNMMQCFVRGDKTIRQKMRELEKKGLTDNNFYKLLVEKA